MSVISRTRAAALGALVALVLAGCTTSDGRSADYGLAFTPSLDDLHGHTWTTDIILDPDRELVPGSTISMKFADNGLSVNAGCNTLVGSATIDDEELVIGKLASTLMGCDKELAAQDLWLTAFLTSRPTIERLDENLWLSNDDTVIHLNEQDD